MGEEGREGVWGVGRVEAGRGTWVVYRLVDVVEWARQGWGVGGTLVVAMVEGRQKTWVYIQLVKWVWFELLEEGEEGGQLVELRRRG